MNEMMFQRLASCVFDLVDNSLMRGTDLSYEQACELIGLDDFEAERVLAIIDEDLALI